MKRVTIYQGTNAPSLSLEFEDVDLSAALVEFVLTPAGESPVTFSTDEGSVTVEAPATAVWTYTKDFANGLNPGPSAVLDVFSTVDGETTKLGGYVVVVGGPGDFF